MKNSERNFNSKSPDEKRRMIEHLIVIHPQMKAILDKMDYCREHAKYALEAIGMLILGEKGTGKSTIKNIYVQRNPPKQTKTSTSFPVLSILIPVSPTEKGLTTSLLHSLKDPFSTKGTKTVQTLRVYNFIEKCKTELLIFDEFQHFAERESFKLNRTVSDWTKNFMNETKKPVILFGTPKSARILDGEENEQLRRRFPFRMTLRPFSWATEEGRQMFRKFLSQVDEKLPLPDPSNLADPMMAERIHYATGGLMFEIMRLIRAAAVLALKRNLPKINLDLLRESFEENLATNSPHLDNPFKQLH
jgi:hypothetical protein